MIQFLVDKGAKLDVVNKKGWTPLTAADGVEYTPNVLKRYPEAAALLRKLMQARGLAVPSSTQPGVGVIAGAPPATAGTKAASPLPPVTPAPPPTPTAPRPATASAPPPTPALEAKTTTATAVYTDEQARRGQAVYKQACAHCHSEDLLGERSAPALVGQPFSARWANLPLDEMLQVIRRTMPQEAPDSLGTQGYVDLITYLLKMNGSPAGTTELTTDAEKLQQISVAGRP